MAKEFVIVIEADNKRAAAAYRKGLEDLDIIWGQLMEQAAAKDARAAERYDEAFKKWEAKAPVEQPQDTGWLGRRKPFNEFSMSQYAHSMTKPHMWDFYTYSVDALNSIRAELKQKLDVAEAAMGPYRMTEHQVHEMVAWEDGSQIERLKNHVPSTLRNLYF